MATVIVAIIVFGLVGLITGKGIYDKKHHKSGCGCDCSSCGGGCHSQKKHLVLRWLKKLLR